MALDQLRASLKCAREFAIEILDSDQVSERDAIRAVLKYNKRIFALARKSDGALALGIDVFDAIALDERLPEKFFNRRLPQMKAKLEHERASRGF